MPRETNSGWGGGFGGEWMGDWMGGEEEVMAVPPGESKGWMGDWQGQGGWMGNWMGFGATVAVIFPSPIFAPRSKLHGWNRRRLLQWGGRHKRD